MATLEQAILPPDTLANRPAAGSPGRIFFATDTGLVYRDNGTTWEDYSETGGGTVVADFVLTGDISPSQITSNQNNYNPTGLSSASTLRLSSDASRDITGLSGGADGRVLLLHNVGSQDIVLKDESGSSTASNRFALNADLTLGADQSALLQYDATSSRWRVVASSVGTGGGGGGGSISAGAFGSRPAAGTAGALYLPTDGFSVDEDSGSAWQAWGPIYPLPEADLSTGWSWVNQSTATFSAERGGGLLTCPAGSSQNCRIRVKSAPSTPYTITAMLDIVTPTGNQWRGGLLWRQSSDGKLVTFDISGEAVDAYLGAVKWSSPTTVSAGYVSTPTLRSLAASPRFLRIVDNGTSRVCQYSPNGRDWITFHTISRTDFLTADQVGFYGSMTHNNDLAVRVYSWAES